MIDIRTYNDLLEIGENEQKRMAFILSAICEHKTSDNFKIAEDAELYFKHLNPTIMKYQKFVHNQAGKKVPDIWSPNNKIASNWYFYFTTQAIQYLLGNGISFSEPETSERLGKGFDKSVQQISTYAKNAGVCFGFWNYDHLEVFPLIDSENTVGFVPLYDEGNGMLRAGIRFWQLDENKPLNITLYEEDGVTSYQKPYEKPIEVTGSKKTYIQNRNYVEKTGKTVGYTDKENYSSLPIFPMYNTHKQSDLIGNQNTIDAYDLIMSGLINNVDEGEFIYWILKNFGGMTEIDDAKFVEQLKLTHVAHADNGEDGASVEAHKTEIPYDASQVSLEILEKQLYKDFMALKVEDISAGATNDQIQAAYEPLNQKTDAFEYQVTEFIENLLEFLGIDDKPSYTRSQLSNRSETLQNVLSASEYLDTEYMTQKILTLLGDADKVKEVLKRLQAEEIDRYGDTETDTTDEEIGGGGDIATTTEAIDTAEQTVGKTLNGAQTQSLLTVMKSLSEGTLTEGQAINIISTAIGVKKDEARAIIRGE